MSDLINHIEEAAQYIRQKTSDSVINSGVVLGSGFKGFVDDLKVNLSISLSDIPHQKCPSVEGHGGELLVAELAGQSIWVLTGRVHMYEGHSPHDVVFTIRVLAKLGLKSLCLTNASGSVNKELEPGSLALIRDHINLTGKNCLEGEQVNSLGATFVDMGEAYDKDWLNQNLSKIAAKEAVYAGVLGPSFETPAEAKMLSCIGADIVGMSTVQETIAARQLGVKIAGLSFVTNWSGGTGDHADHHKVLDLVEKRKCDMTEAVKVVLAHAPME